MDEQLSLSYHESGHTVALYTHGRAAEYVTIEPGPNGRAGHTQPVEISDAEVEKDFVGHTKRELVYRLSAYYAAMYAELTPTTPQREFEQIMETQLDVAGLSAANRGEDRGDIYSARLALEILEELGQNQLQCAREGVQQAIDLVWNYRVPIGHLALWLVQNRTLSRDKIELVLRPYGLVRGSEGTE